MCRGVLVLGGVVCWGFDGVFPNRVLTDGALAEGFEGFEGFSRLFF